MKRHIRKFISHQLSVYLPTLKTKLLYKRYFGKPLDLSNPVTLNEKIQYLKLNCYNNNALITQCADKYAVREYVESKGCEDILNELYFSCDSVNDIPWDSLPNKFVIKGNHGAGYNLICQDKRVLDIDSATKTINEWMREDFWKKNVELNYKNIKKKIIGEKYIDTPDGRGPDDYKVYCFHGTPHCMMLCIGRDKGVPKFVYFDRDFKVLPYSQDSLELTPDEINSFVKPEGYDEIFTYAEKLATPFDFVRADFYLSNGKVIFGELTFTPSGGLDNERLVATDKLFGDFLVIKK
ncbi:glycosyl transferase [Serratia marcescens]|nr:glycosyl transferase [Serratia marcescens]